MSTSCGRSPNVVINRPGESRHKHGFLERVLAVPNLDLDLTLGVADAFTSHCTSNFDGKH